jgi:hypothetical protein
MRVSGVWCPASLRCGGGGVEVAGAAVHPARSRPVPGRVGWVGALHAKLARDLTATLGGAQWRFAVTDEYGQLIYCGITRARPTGTLTRSAACRAMVELQVPAAALRALAADATTLADWAGVVADLARQLDHDVPDEGRYCDVGRAGRPVRTWAEQDALYASC